MKTWLAVAILGLVGTLAWGAGRPPKDDLTASFEDVLREEISAALETGEAGPLLSKVFSKFELDDLLRILTTEKDMTPVVYEPVICPLCSVGVDQVLEMARNGTEPEVIIDALIDLCVDLGIANLNFCENFLHDVEEELIWIVGNRENLTGDDFCGMFLAGLGCETSNPDRIWQVPLPDENKPPVVDPVLPPEGSPVMKVLHLADTHYDPDYLPGSNAVCEERFYCCRAESGPVINPEDAAGNWGDYRNCDAPQWLLQAMYDHIRVTHQDLDFIIWTGDLVPHNIWNITRESNLEIIRDSVQMIADNFPGVPVFPAIGNHESDPVNSFPQPYIDNEFDISWLYDEITVLWSTWLPPEVAQNIAYGAYYSTMVKPGLKMVSMNSNYCYSFNWWLVYDDIDPAEELVWIANELDASEKNGEKVYLIAHIPSGNSDCTRTWSHEFNKIVFRYENTVAGIFYGHTHKDHFNIFYDPVEPTRPYHVAYISPSQTPYSFLNPGYKVYTIDGDYDGSSYQVLDHENWIADLELANLNNFPEFVQLYTAKNAYNMTDLTPASWDYLITQMKEPNSTLFDSFYRHYVKAARPQVESGCGDVCKNSILCGLVVSDSSDHSHCD